MYKRASYKTFMPSKSIIKSTKSKKFKFLLPVSPTVQLYNIFKSGTWNVERTKLCPQKFLDVSPSKWATISQCFLLRMSCIFSKSVGLWSLVVSTGCRGKLLCYILWVKSRNTPLIVSGRSNLTSTCFFWAYSGLCSFVREHTVSFTK